MLQVGHNRGITSRGNRRQSAVNIKTSEVQRQLQLKRIKIPLLPPPSKIGVLEQKNNIFVNE